MGVHLIVEAGIAAFVGARHGAQIYRAGIRVNYAVPDYDDASLPLGHTIVVGANELGSLRDQQIMAGRSVVHVVGHLAHNHAGHITVDASDHHGWDHGAG